jgi:hypothetical protein
MKLSARGRENDLARSKFELRRIAGKLGAILNELRACPFVLGDEEDSASS